MNFTLIGCTGTVGQGISKYLLSNGHSLIGSSRKSVEYEGNFRNIKLDLLSKSMSDELCSLLENPEHIILNAALLPGTHDTFSDEDFYEGNVIRLNEILGILGRNSKLKSLVYISSGSQLFPMPISIKESVPYNTSNSYYTTKAIGELMVDQMFIQQKRIGNIFRISSPFGYDIRRNSVIPKFIKRLLNNEKIELWGIGSREQVFTFCEDIGYACELAAKHESSGIYNITSGPAISMMDLALKIIGGLNKNQSDLVLLDKFDPLEGKRISIDITKAKNELHYQPKFGLDQGLKQVLDNFRER